MHEKYCLINTVKCKFCEDFILKDEQEEHEQQYHGKIVCSDCGKNFEKLLYSIHKNKCSKRKVECSYCSLSLVINELHEHEYMCGSKTEECYKCGQLIPIMGKLYLKIFRIRFTCFIYL